MTEINIAMVMDANYLLPTSVTMFSAIKNKNKETNYNFYIISQSFNVDICRKLRAFKSDSVKVNLIECRNLNLGELHNPAKNSYCVASPAALLKFKIPDLIPNKDKVLYIDGDLIIREDLSSIFQIDLGECYAGVIPDTGSLYSGNPIVRSYKTYFNSGVMLLNLRKLRNDNSSQKLFELKAKSRNEKLMDQNVFNEYLNNKTKLLPIIYNCLYINLVRSRNKYTIIEFNKRFSTNFESLEELKQKAVIIHYSSKDKPWKYCNIPLADEWLNYYYQYCAQFGFDSSKLVLKYSGSYRNDREFLPEVRPNIVVSLTSFPGRIGIVHLAICDILSQSIPPDRVVLYLSREQFPKRMSEMPSSLKVLVDENKLIIKFVDDDLRAHKKYFYAFKEYAGSIIITIDDDLRYNRFMIERLVASHYRNPRSIIATRVHLITGDLKKNTISAYSAWRKEYNGWIDEPSHQLFATHGAGTLFPPYSLNLERLCNAEDIKNLCLLADDLWLKINEVLSNTQIVLAAPHIKLDLIEGSQDEALWKLNVLSNLNDQQLNKLLDKYNKINSKETIIGRIFQATPYPNLLAKGGAGKIEIHQGGSNAQKKEIDYEEKFYFQKGRCESLKKSVSYRIGRIITYIPRLIIRNLKSMH